MRSALSSKLRICCLRYRGFGGDLARFLGGGRTVLLHLMLLLYQWRVQHNVGVSHLACDAIGGRYLRYYDQRYSVSIEEFCRLMRCLRQRSHEPARLHRRASPAWYCLRSPDAPTTADCLSVCYEQYDSHPRHEVRRPQQGCVMGYGLLSSGVVIDLDGQQTYLLPRAKLLAEQRRREESTQPTDF